MTRRSTSRVRPRKAPIQRRARVTVDAILGATARILVRSGWDSLTTNRVAERAGVSIGTLYEWFPSKEALVGALLDAHLGRAEAALEAVVIELAGSARTLSLRALATRMAETMVALHEDEPRLHRVLSEEIPQTAAARARVHALEAKMTTVLAAVFAAHPHVRVRDPEVAARLVVVTLEAATHRWATGGDETPLPREVLVEELATLIEAYLRAAPKRARRKAERPRSSPTAASRE